MEENSLRLIFLMIGVVILVGIYFYDVLKKKKANQQEEFAPVSGNERVDPVMSAEPSFSAVFEEQQVASAESKIEPVIADAGAAIPVVKQEDIPVAKQAPVIQLAVLPKAGEALSGTALLDLFTELNLEFGDMGIFHCYERHDDVEVQRFHLANILEPGTFPVGSMSDFESTGIVLFFQANDSGDPELAFDRMLNVAQQLSQGLDAMLVDAEMNELSLDKIGSIQSQLAGLSRL